MCDTVRFTTWNVNNLFIQFEYIIISLIQIFVYGWLFQNASIQRNEMTPNIVINDWHSDHKGIKMNALKPWTLYLDFVEVNTVNEK